MELSQKQLEEMVVGKPIDPTIRFYEKAVIDVEASQAAGRRIYNNILMIERRIPGVTDYVPSRAKAHDIRRYPAEYAAYQNTVQRKKSPEVAVIPGISNVEAQELIDRGLGTVERLATSTDVPDHLGHLVQMARRIHEAIKAEEQSNAHEEENQQEDRREEVSAEAVPSPDRQHHGPHVGQREVPPVPGDPREAGGRVRSRRRDDSGKDWEVTFQL